MEEILLSAAVGVIIGISVIAMPTLIPKDDQGKKNDDIVIHRERKSALKLSADKVLEKATQYPQFQQALGLSDEDIRKAVEDVNRQTANNDGSDDTAAQALLEMEPVNWVKIVEWVIILAAVYFLFWFLNVQSKGEVLHWVCTYFPRECSTLGVESTYTAAATATPALSVVSPVIAAKLTAVDVPPVI